MSKQTKPNIYIIIHRSNNVRTVKQQNCCWFKLKQRKKHHLFIFLISTNLTQKHWLISLLIDEDWLLPQSQDLELLLCRWITQGIATTEWTTLLSSVTLLLPQTQTRHHAQFLSLLRVGKCLDLDVESISLGLCLPSSSDNWRHFILWNCPSCMLTFTLTFAANHNSWPSPVQQ